MKHVLDTQFANSPTWIHVLRNMQFHSEENSLQIMTPQPSHLCTYFEPKYII